MQTHFNGNISQNLWKTDSDNVRRSYDYKYDNLNRLLKGIYQRGTNVENVTHSYDEIIYYDKNGNITDLKRHGYLDVHTGESTYLTDDLVYGYNGNQSNRLMSVLDQTQSIDGFKDGNTNGADYDYDNYGNMITELVSIKPKIFKIKPNKFKNNILILHQN